MIHLAVVLNQEAACFVNFGRSPLLHEIQALLQGTRFNCYFTLFFIYLSKILLNYMDTALPLLSHKMHESATQYLN